MPVQRYKILVAYRGTRYHGWQQQKLPPTWKGAAPADGAGLPTVQETLCRAIASIVGHPVAMLGSSRTDAGVHARGQIAHFDTDSLQIPPNSLRRAVNARLPGDILIRQLAPVDPGFDAVKSTRSKQYEYVICTTLDRPVFNGDLCWHRWQRLDLDSMNTAAAQLVGTHDFASFAKPGHGREHTVRTVTACDVRTESSERLVIRVAGTGFLWQMVRIIVGTLVQVGMGKIPAAQITPMLQARDRKSAGPTAPAHGLFLDQIWLADPAATSSEPPQDDATPSSFPPADQTVE